MVPVTVSKVGQEGKVPAASRQDLVDSEGNGASFWLCDGLCRNAPEIKFNSATVRVHRS